MENFRYNNDIKAIEEELVRGLEFANRLRDMMMNNSNGDDDSESSSLNPEELVKKVHMSFTNSLFLFDKKPTSEVNNPTIFQDSQQSNCKSSINKGRRGCYKRRRTAQTWEHESELPLEDGHQWRKYGQKVILNAKYPRNYYRCTHKYDQNCQAMKQVQRVEDNPPLHKTTYYGNHTCRNILNNSEIILDDSTKSASHSFVFLSYDNTFSAPPKLQDCPSFFSSKPLLVKKEEDIIPSSSSNDFLLSPHNNSSSQFHSDYMPTAAVFYNSSQLDQFPFCPFNFND